MSSSDNIKVFIRVRPLNERETLEDPNSIIFTDKNKPGSLLVNSKTELKTFNFNWIAPESSTQQEIFEVVGKPMADTCLQGYNCCIFAYGQTGAGKTYTMQGRGLNSRDEVHCGLEPRILDHIFFLKAQDEAEHPDVRYSITCGYLEIYNEQIIDLFNPSQKSLNVREDLKEGVFIENLKEIQVSNSQETLKHLQLGARNRHIGSTNMNLESSRSHSLFIMTIQRKTPTATFTSKFNFVDLAGSEIQKATNTAGTMLIEAGNINKSLSVLGRVINKLVEAAEGKALHIPYRDSKLTFIIRDSLGGNSKTCIIANVSPAVSSLQETISTLKFAQRAKQIKNIALINEDLSEDVDYLKRELERVKKELAYYKQLELENLARQDSTRYSSQFFEQSRRFSGRPSDTQFLNQIQSRRDSSVSEMTSLFEETVRRENQLWLGNLNPTGKSEEITLRADEHPVNIVEDKRENELEIESLQGEQPRKEDLLIEKMDQLTLEGLAQQKESPVELKKNTEDQNKEASEIKETVSVKGKQSSGISVENHFLHGKMAILEEQNKNLEAEVSRLKIVKSEYEERFKVLVEEKERYVYRNERVHEELEGLKGMMRNLKHKFEGRRNENNQKEETQSFSQAQNLGQEMERLRNIVEEQAKKELNYENRIRELEKSLETERKEKFNLIEILLQYKTKDSDKEKAQIMTIKEENPNPKKVNLRPFSIKPLGHNLQKENRFVEETLMQKQGLHENISRTSEDFEVENSKQKCEEYSEKKIVDCKRREKSLPIYGHEDNKENNFRHNKESEFSKGKNQSGLQISSENKSSENLRNMNIERDGLSEQNQSQREGKENWDSANNSADFDDLKRVKKIEPSISNFTPF